ncbi:MAG: RHS repeat-associated core domain-containing protein, partial [Candidatus Hydrogenedentota bacterium]
IEEHNPYGYTGREMDSETGLMFYRSRYFSSEQRRFVQKDRWNGIKTVPMTYINAYAYVGNNPINAVDPYGTFSALGTFGTVLMGAGGLIMLSTIITGPFGLGFGAIVFGLGAAAFTMDVYLSIRMNQLEADELKRNLEKKKKEGPAGEIMEEVHPDIDYITPRLPDDEDKKPDECVDD